jgi:hypothetical protein
VWSRILVVAALVALAVTPVAASQGVTTAPDVFISIHVTLTDSKVIVSPKSAPRGAAARFIVRNVGKKVHTFTVRTGSLTGFSRAFKPGGHAILLLYLSYRGVLPYYGGTTFASTPKPMKGTIIVGAACAACIQD